jgi:hypothetical protein
LEHFFVKNMGSGTVLWENTHKREVDTEEAGRIEIEAAGKRLFVGER